MKILDIDAWKENGSWTWNNWFHVGDIEKDEFEQLDNNRKILKYFRDHGYTSDESIGRLAVDDDQYNIVIVDKNTLRPLYAIEYGREY